MVFTKSATKLQKVFQNTIFFTKKLYVFTKDFVFCTKRILCKENNVAMFSDGKNNRYDLREKCTILIESQILLIYFSPSLSRLLLFCR